METVGAETTRQLADNSLRVQLNVGAGEEGLLQVWVGTQNADGSFLGYTYPSADNPHTARNYTLVGTEVVY